MAAFLWARIGHDGGLWLLQWTCGRYGGLWAPKHHAFKRFGGFECVEIVRLTGIVRMLVDIVKLLLSIQIG